jgi:hypothetical protein
MVHGIVGAIPFLGIHKWDFRCTVEVRPETMLVGGYWPPKVNTAIIGSGKAVDHKRGQ